MRRLAGRIAHLGAWVLYVEDGRMEWSDETRRLLDVDDESEASLARGLATLHQGDSRPLMEASLRACQEHGTPFDVDIHVVTERGNARTLRVIGEPSADADGVIDQIHGAIQDVTEVRRIAAEAREAGERLMATLDTIDDGFAHIDLEWRFTYLNRRAEAIIGRPAAELRHGTIWEAFPGLEGSRFDFEYHRAMRTQTTVRFEEYWPPFDKWIEVDAYPSREGLTIYFRDVSARRRAQDELALLHTTVSHLPDAFVIGAYPFTPEGEDGDARASKLVFVNPAFERRAGRTASELLGLTIDKLFISAASPAIRDWVYQTLGRRETARGEFMVGVPGDPPSWIEVDIAPIPDDQGRHRHWMLVSRDVSRRKAQEQAAQESLDRFRLFARATNDTIWDWDLVKDDVWWNEGFSDMFGFERESFPKGGDGWKSHLHPDDRVRVLAGIEAVIAGGGDTWMDEYRFLRADGWYATVLDRGFVIRNADGKAVRMVGGMTDLTERRRADERLSEQATLLDLARDAIMLRGLDGEIRFWNRGAERVYGYPREEAIGHSMPELLSPDPEVFRAGMAALITNGEWSGEIESRRKDGSKVIIEARWTLVRDAAGAPKDVLCINSDITEKKQLETQFLRAQRLESIGTLAGGIAHDLNNVLMPILMSTELLKMSARDDEAREYVENVRVSAQRAADMVKQVLSFARGIEGERAPVQLRHLADEVVRIAAETFPKSIRVDMRYGHELWPVVGSPTQISQVLLNLLVNARDAMPHGGRVVLSLENVMLDEVYTEMNPDAAPGPYVVIKVTDNGEGIPAAIQDRVFEPFFTTKEVGRGTGLGLSTALGIVKSHRGFVHLYSELGKGTTFKVYLPANASQIAVAAHENAAEPTSLPRGMGETILVVDDERAIREIMERTLTRFGYQVMVASNGAEAVALYAQHHQRIDVVLTDMAMPIMDGPATAVALRAINPAVRIVGSSGLTANGLVAKAAGAGVETFIPKPYSAETVLQVLRDLLAPERAK